MGNLVLLPPKLNSKLQNKDPGDKIEEYRKTGLLIAREVADTIADEGWNAKAIERREDALLAWAAVLLKLLGIPADLSSSRLSLSASFKHQGAN